MKKLTNSLILITLLFSSVSFATTISDLQKADKVRIETSASASEAAIGEQIILKIKVSTQTWFTRGTRIKVPQIENAILLQQNKLATNFSSRENGKTWSHQLWELTFYPQSSGEYYIPSIPVTIEVNNSPDKVSGVLLSEPLSIKSLLPNGSITEDMNWLSAESFSVKQKINKGEDEDVIVGDAIIREIEYNTRGALAMLIPDLPDQSAVNTRLYNSPSENKDHSVRGDYKSWKKQKLTYIIQSDGEINIPDINIYWWDTKNKELKKEVLEGYSYISKHTPLSWLKSKTVEISLFFVLSILLFLFRNPILKTMKIIKNSDFIKFYLALLKGDKKILNQMNYKKLDNIENEISFSKSKNISKEINDDWKSNYNNKNKKNNLYPFYKIWISLKKNKEKRKKNKVLKEL